MKQLMDCLPEALELIKTPAEARPELLAAGKKLVEQQGEEMLRLCALFMENPEDNAKTVYEQLDLAAEKCGVHSYTASFVFLCWNLPAMRQKYAEAGISDGIFCDTAMDLHYKLAECHQVYNIWGTFVRGWFPGFFALTRFALGRLQYEYTSFRVESYTAGGVTVKKDDRVLTMHIPSAGPLTKDLREDSYRRAYEFYKNDFKGMPVVFTCSSWLLYPSHEVMFPKTSNVVSFLHDFDILYSTESDTFDNAWRIFGADGDKPADQLPRNTSMQRAYADWLLSGHKAGWGFGAFLFDGQKFIRVNGCSEHL